MEKSISDIHYVKLVPIGSCNPNNPISDSEREEQLDILNRCLDDYPRGTIIGKDVTIGKYKIGEHEVTMEKVTSHVGFERRPVWDKGN